MPEPTTKRLAVTFTDGLPLGTCGSFTHNKQKWIAYPAAKNTEIVAVMDRLLGIHAGLSEAAVRFINAHPDNAGVHELAAAILSSTGRARELAAEKGRAVTS